MKLSRRQWLQAGLLGTLALGVAGRLAAPPLPATVAGGHPLLLQLAHAMLGPLPASAPLALERNLARAVAGLPPSSQRELAQLLALLQLPLAARLLGPGVAWSQAGTAQLQAMLAGWRHSRLPLLRAAYQGLHSLFYAAWYGDDASWSACGYQLPLSMKDLLDE